jgi:hypothetical protein
MGSVLVGLATLAILATIIFLVIGQARTQIVSIEGLGNDNATNCATSIACNATDTLRSSTQDAVGFVPLIVIAAIGAVLLGLVTIFRRNN